MKLTTLNDAILFRLAQ